MNAIVDVAPVPDPLSRAELLAALKKDFEGSSHHNGVRKKTKSSDAHNIAMLAVRCPNLAEALK